MIALTVSPFLSFNSSALRRVMALSMRLSPTRITTCDIPAHNFHNRSTKLVSCRDGHMPIIGVYLLGSRQVIPDGPLLQSSGEGNMKLIRIVRQLKKQRDRAEDEVNRLVAALA